MMGTRTALIWTSARYAASPASNPKEATVTEYSETCFKKRRGMSRRSLDVIEAMRAVAEAAQPITGRGVGYKLFNTYSLIPSMATNEMAKVYRLLKIAREQGAIPWQWIVDETRELERVSTWDDPKQFARCLARSYRRDFWNQQPHRVQVLSEKGTVRGVLSPVLDEYAVGFLPVHGFSSATIAHDLAEDDDGRPLILLYVGDWIRPSQARPVRLEAAIRKRRRIFLRRIYRTSAVAEAETAHEAEVWLEAQERRFWP
jgi:hypothetical protein